MTSSGEYTIQNRVLKEMHRERMARIECHSKKVFVEYGDGNGLWLKELKGKALGTQRWASGDRFAAMVASSGGRYQELKSFLENCVNGVELGCGVGTAGLMLAKVYTRMRMTLTDQPQCISLAEENVSFNNLGDRVTVSAYSWGDSVDTFAADPPDFVVATDVLYHASVFDKFLSSLEAFAGLRRERSIRVVIAYQPRTDDDKEFVKRVLLPRLEELSILRYEDDREVDSSTTCVLFLGRIKAASVYSVQCVFKATGGGIEPAPSHLVTRHKIATTQSERITGLMISPTCRPKCMSISSARGTISPLRISEGTPPRLSGLISIRARQTVRLPWFEVPE